MTYQQRLTEFLRVTGKLSTCAPTCPFPDGEHDEREMVAVSLPGRTCAEVSYMTRERYDESRNLKGAGQARETEHSGLPGEHPGAPSFSVLEIPAK